MRRPLRSSALAGVLLAGSVWVPATAVAQGPGRSGAAILRLPASPRSAALGGAVSTGSGAEPFTFLSNPAAAAAPGARGLAATYRAHRGDVAVGGVAAGVDLGPGRFAVALRYLDLGEVSVVVPDPAFGGERGVPTGGRASGGELALSAAYAGRVGPVRLGAAVSGVRSELAELSDVAVAGDVGAALDLAKGRLMASVAAQHLGPDAGPGRPADLPRSVRAGLALRPGWPRPADVLVAVEVAGPTDDVQPRGGLEVRFDGGSVGLIGRAGWDGAVERGDAVSRWAVGGGLVVGSWTLDYAYRGLGPLGESHQFGFRWSPEEGGG